MRPRRAPVRALVRLTHSSNVSSFAYINQPAPISPCSFLDTPLANARYIHMCAAPAAVEAAAAELAAIRAEVSPSDGPLSTWRPAIVWEPHPQTCRPDQLEDFKASLALVDVCSPNHEEAAGAAPNLLSLLLEEHH